MRFTYGGSRLHAREAFKILWEYDIDINKLKCPKSKTSPLEHNCSGKHAAFSYMQKNELAIR